MHFGNCDLSEPGISESLHCSGWGNIMERNIETMKRLADPRIRILKGTPIQPENTTSSSTSMPDPRPIFSADTGHLWCFRVEKGVKDLPFIENEWVIKDSKLSSWHSQDFACLRQILKFTHSFLFHRCICVGLPTCSVLQMLPCSCQFVHPGGCCYTSGRIRTLELKLCKICCQDPDERRRKRGKMDVNACLWIMHGGLWGNNFWKYVLVSNFALL